MPPPPCPYPFSTSSMAVSCILYFAGRAVILEASTGLDSVYTAAV